MNHLTIMVSYRADTNMWHVASLKADGKEANRYSFKGDEHAKNSLELVVGAALDDFIAYVDAWRKDNPHAQSA